MTREKHEQLTREKHGQLTLWAAFRCTCGRVVAAGDQPNGNAGVVHECPRCPRFEALRTHDQAVEYFQSLPVLPLTATLVRQIEQSSQN
jgi:hypothetical protein